MKSLNNYKAIINTHENQLVTLYKSMLIGVLVGITASAYRTVLKWAETLSSTLYGFLRQNLWYLPLAFLLLGIAGYLIGVLNAKFKMIGGSGIPQVKGIIMGHFKNRWYSTLLAKFFGGTICILGGLSLGREGPSVQIGACVAEAIGKRFGSSRTERKILIASGASAGLSAAFNAPLAGTMFALEEIFKYISPLVLLSTMTAAVVADFVCKIFFGTSPVFQFDITQSIPLSYYWLLFPLGILLGAFGAFYNWFLLLTQKFYDKILFLNGKGKMIIPFLIAGVFGIFYPLVLGGGHHVVEDLTLSKGVCFLIILLLLKFLFSMISFGSGAPGGIFFPLLIIGATFGALYGNLSINYLGVDQNLFYNFIILAMAGYFTAIVRAPITGIILLVEMTGSFSHLLSLTIVSIAAYVTADLLKSAPIYESLLENQVTKMNSYHSDEDDSKRVTVEAIIQHGAQIENRYIKNIKLPPNCLLIAVRREGKEMIPNGSTRLLAGDLLIVLTSVRREAETRMRLETLTIHKERKKSKN